MKVKELMPYFGEIHLEEQDEEAKYVILSSMSNGTFYAVPTADTTSCSPCSNGIKMELTSNLLTAILVKFSPIDYSNLDVREKRKSEITKFFKQVAKEQGLI